MEDYSAHTLRELLTLARERLGAAAGGLKTREELLAALGASPAPVVETRTRPAAAKGPELVTRDFFRRRSE